MITEHHYVQIVNKMPSISIMKAAKHDHPQTKSSGDFPVTRKDKTLWITQKKTKHNEVFIRPQGFKAPWKGRFFGGMYFLFAPHPIIACKFLTGVVLYKADSSLLCNLVSALKISMQSKSSLFLFPHSACPWHHSTGLV